MRKHRLAVRLNDEEYAKLLTVRQWYGSSFASVFRDGLDLSYDRILQMGATPITVSDVLAHRHGRSRPSAPPAGK